jgi:redox-sensitive bicupin YhaK (pirin superfamily)
MVTVRRSEERGHARRGWLESYHTFSFADYYDPEHMGFRALRVINEDWIAPGMGFGTHPHRDMEIVTYVLEGALEHQDSMGTRAVIRPGEVQRMSAGTGVTHSEYNASKTESVHLMQIWLLPARAGLQPSYEQTAFPADEGRNAFRLVAAPDGRDGAVTIQTDAELYLARLDAGQGAAHPLKAGRHAWVHVARGAVTLNGQPLATGDAAAVSGEEQVALVAAEDAEVLLFDLG